MKYYTLRRNARFAGRCNAVPEKPLSIPLLRCGRLEGMDECAPQIEELTMPLIDINEARDRAIRQYNANPNNRPINRFDHCIVNRITFNYIRHQLFSYDAIMDRIRMSGFDIAKYQMAFINDVAYGILDIFPGLHDTVMEWLTSKEAVSDKMYHWR